MHGLWLQGFAAESRAVSTLIRQFVHGLKSLKLAKMMLGDPRGLPEDYEAVRLRAIESQGQIELMEAVVKVVLPVVVVVVMSALPPRSGVARV